jgi:hypothetical protein
MNFLTILDVCSQNSSGHKTVTFGRNTYLYWHYSLTKRSFNSEGVSLEMPLFCVDLMWNDPEALLDVSKEIGLEVTVRKPSTCSCLVTRLQGRVII